MQVIELRRRELEERDACAPGLDWFDEALAVQNRRRWRGEMTGPTDATP